MRNTKELCEIAKLLGEENEKRLKDSITDIIIEEVKRDIESLNVYLIDVDELIDDIREDIRSDLKERLYKEYMEIIENKLDMG